MQWYFLYWSILNLGQNSDAARHSHARWPFMLYEMMKLFAVCHVSQYMFEDIGCPSETVCEILIQILEILIGRVVKKIFISRRIRESSRHVFPGRTARGRHITIDINSSIQVSTSSQTCSIWVKLWWKHANKPDWKREAAKLNADHKTNGLITNAKQKKKTFPWGKNFS